MHTYSIGYLFVNIHKCNYVLYNLLFTFYKMFMQLFYHFVVLFEV